MSLCMIFYDALTLSWELFERLNAPFFMAMRWVSAIFWTLDSGMSFLTAVYIRGELQTGLHDIAHQYLTTWFFFDLICTVPLWIVIFEEDDESKFTSAFRLAKMLRYARLIRLAKFKHLLDALLSRINSITALLAARSFNELLFLALWVHVSGSMWYFLGTYDDGWVFDHGFAGATPSYRYLVSIHWSAAQLQGSTDMTPGSTAAERAYAVITIFLSVVILARFVSRLTNIMIELHEVYSQNNQNSTIRTYFDKHGVSTDLQMRVRTYVEASQRGRSMQRQDQEESLVLQVLPTAMRRQVIMESRALYISSNPPLLATQVSSPRCFERLCCDCLQTVWMIPDEQLFSFGELCSSMYFVAEGRMCYLKYCFALRNFATPGTMKLSKARTKTMEKDTGACIERLCHQGKALSEAVLWTNWVHCGDATAQSHAALLKLNTVDFQAVTSSYTVVDRVMKRHAQLFVKILNKVERMQRSDLFDSVVVIDADEQDNPAKFMKRMHATHASKADSWISHMPGIHHVI